MPIFDKPDIVAATPEEARDALSAFYEEPVTFEGTGAPLRNCARFVKQGTHLGVIYTFRGNDGALYSIPLPMEVANAFLDEVPLDAVTFSPT
jgi:hypothetical protein